MFSYQFKCDKCRKAVTEKKNFTIWVRGNGNFVKDDSLESLPNGWKFIASGEIYCEKCLETK